MQKLKIVCINFHYFLDKITLGINKFNIDIIELLKYP